MSMRREFFIHFLAFNNITILRQVYLSVNFMYHIHLSNPSTIRVIYFFTLGILVPDFRIIFLING